MTSATTPADAVINRAIVARLLAEYPRRTDAQIAEIATLEGRTMSGETVRRHRIALGIQARRR